MYIKLPNLSIEYQKTAFLRYPRFESEQKRVNNDEFSMGPTAFWLSLSRRTLRVRIREKWQLWLGKE